MKKLFTLVVVLSLFFLAGCEKPAEDETIQTLDGTYELLDYYNTYNELAPAIMLVTYDEYTLIIDGNDVRVETIIKGQSKDVIDTHIVISKEYFTIDGYDGILYYFSSDYSYIETVNTSLDTKYEEKMFFKKVDSKINLDAKNYSNKTYELKNANGYYELKKVTSEFFLTFEISFIDHEKAKVEIVSPELNYTKIGTYQVYLKSIIIKIENEIVILHKDGSNFDFNYFRVKFEKSLDEFSVKLVEKREVGSIDFIDLDFQYNKDIHNEIVERTRPIFTHESKKLSVEYEYLTESNLKEYYHKTGNHYIVKGWTGSIHHHIDGYVLQPYEGLFYAPGYTETLPEFDIFSYITTRYQMAKVNDTYFIKVNNQTFGSSQNMTPIYYHTPISSSELNLNMYLEINIYDTEIHIDFYDNKGSLFLTSVYSNEHDSDQAMNEIKQTFSNEIESALIPVEIEYTYEVDFSFFYDSSNLDRFNFVKIDLEPGFYYFIGNGMYSSGLYDKNFTWLSDKTVRFSNAENIFGFEVVENEDPFYIMIRSYGRENYDYTIKEVSNFDLTEIEFREGTQNIIISNIPNGIYINKSFTEQTRVRVEFVPIENELGIIQFNYASRADKLPFDVTLDIGVDEMLEIKIYTSGTLKITIINNE